MRVTTAFNKMLGLVGASARNVTFAPEGIVVGLRRRRAKHACPCGHKTWSTYDRSVRRWRHLDLGATRCFLEAEIARIDCRRCGRVRTEEVSWARPGARHTKDLQDVVAWLAQRTDKTTITRLLRISWEAVAKIVIDVVAEAIDDTRLENLYRIGVDEVSYRKGHRYLTVVADHYREGAVIWVGEGKGHSVLEAFYDELGEERLARLQCVSLDMGGAYKLATDNLAPPRRPVRGPLSPGQAGQRRLGSDQARGLEPVPGSRALQGSMVETHPLGTLEGGGEPHRGTARGPAPTPPTILCSVPGLAAEGGNS